MPAQPNPGACSRLPNGVNPPPVESATRTSARTPTSRKRRAPAHRTLTAMRFLVATAILAAACSSSGSSAITCELAGDHVHAVINARELRTKIADLCRERDWSASARACVAGAPSLDELRGCAGDLGDSAVLLDKAISDERRRIAKEHDDETDEKRRGLRIDLPSGRSTEIDPSVESLVLEVTPELIVVAGKPIRDDDLDNLFRAAYARNKATQVLLKAARDVPHARVVQLMERAKQAGLSRLAIGTRAE
jgi:hypothetical protein